MKKSQFKKLKVGDTITVRTVYEIMVLKHSSIVDGGVVLVDNHIESLFEKCMGRLCGKKCTVTRVISKDVVVAHTFPYSVQHCFTRKMLK